MVILKDQPVYLLAGTEQYLKEENLARIKSAFLDKSSCDFNFNVFHAGLASAEKILESAQTLPFLGGKRVVLVRRIEDFSASDRKFILSYLKAPQKYTLLVLETCETNLEQSFFAEVSRLARVIFCQPLETSQLFSWIDTFVKAAGKKIERDACRLLLENLGSELQLLAGSLQSLILYIGKKETIEIGDVEKLVGRDLSASAFELFEAIVARNKQQALQILDSLLKDGTNSSQILGAFAYQMISQRLKGSPVLFKRAFEDLQTADADIKTGRQKPRLALELLIVRLGELFQLAH